MACAYNGNEIIYFATPILFVWPCLLQGSPSELLEGSREVPGGTSQEGPRIVPGGRPQKGSREAPGRLNAPTAGRPEGVGGRVGEGGLLLWLVVSS